MFELGFSKKHFFHVLSSSKFSIDSVVYGIEKRMFFNFSLSSVKDVVVDKDLGVLIIVLFIVDFVVDFAVNVVADVVVVVF